MFTTSLRKEALLEHVGLVEMTFLAVLSYAEWRHVFDHSGIMWLVTVVCVGQVKVRSRLCEYDGHCFDTYELLHS